LERSIGQDIPSRCLDILVREMDLSNGEEEVASQLGLSGVPPSSSSILFPILATFEIQN
jgi:hypothetical protein